MPFTDVIGHGLGICGGDTRQEADVDAENEP